MVKQQQQDDSEFEEFEEEPEDEEEEVAKPTPMRPAPAIPKKGGVLRPSKKEEEAPQPQYIGVPRVVSMEQMVNAIYDDLQEIKAILQEKLK